MLGKATRVRIVTNDSDIVVKTYSDLKREAADRSRWQKGLMSMSMSMSIVRCLTWLK